MLSEFVGGYTDCRVNKLNFSYKPVKIVSHSKEEHRLRVFEDRALRKMSGPNNTEEITGARTKLHDEYLHDLYCSPSII